MGNDWRNDLEQLLTPFVGALRHKTRGRMCPAYVAGLIGPGDRKSVQPMAARDDALRYDQLHHFVASGVWPLCFFPAGVERAWPDLGGRHSLQTEGLWNGAVASP